MFLLARWHMGIRITGCFGPIFNMSHATVLSLEITVL